MNNSELTTNQDACPSKSGFTMHSYPLALPFDYIFRESDEMPYDLVGGVRAVVKVHVDMANAGLKEELSVIPIDQLLL